MTEALWGWPPPVLDPAGPYADPVTTLAWLLLGMGVIVTGVVVVALYIALRGSPEAKARLGGETTVWLGGIAFPGVVLTALLVYGLTLTASLTEEISGDELRIRVTGEMWWFRVEYLAPDGSVIFADANEIHLPVGEPAVIELESADVIHSFWVPHLSGKMDMIPGRTNLLRVEAGREGTYGGVCAEYCGGPHALMGFVAVAHGTEQWAEFVSDRTSGDAPPAVPPVAADVDESDLSLTRALPGDASGYPNETETLERYDARKGYRLFLDSGCGACHRIAGTEANGEAGPDLTHVGSRSTLAAGILPNNCGTMMGWIADSQSIKPGNRMPSYDRLSVDELGHIAAFLELQK